MLELIDLIENDERIVTYHLMNEYVTRNAIITQGSDDILGALELTLHRLIDNGATPDDIFRIMGAYVATETELQELMEYDEYIDIDLCYILPSLIDMWK
nr:MAG TPA: steroid receptor coactivator [Caudoviricetes sp.]